MATLEQPAWDSSPRPCAVSAKLSTAPAPSPVPLPLLWGFCGLSASLGTEGRRDQGLFYRAPTLHQNDAPCPQNPAESELWRLLRLRELIGSWSHLPEREEALFPSGFVRLHRSRLPPGLGGSGPSSNSFFFFQETELAPARALCSQSAGPQALCWENTVAGVWRASAGVGGEGWRAVPRPIPANVQTA